MKILEIKQGSDQWLAIREKHYTASEAAAMLGASKYMGRNELLKIKKTGISPDIDEHTQILFDKGHAAEKSARPLAEKIINEEFFPVVGVVEIDGLPLLASFDGLTLDGRIVWETKLWNENLAKAVRAGELPPNYYWQLEQQILVASAEKAMFMVTDGTEENLEWMYYHPVPGRAEKLLSAWSQFGEDLKNYEHTETAPLVTGEVVIDLPSVSVEVSGALAIKDNFEIFETALRDFIDNRLVKEPKTDQDFADLDLQIKSLKKAESALDASEAHALAQISTIDDLKRTKDMLHKMARDHRLLAEKLLKSEKENRRNEIQVSGQDQLQAHIDSLDERVQGYMPVKTWCDFVAAMKGKRTIASLQDAVDTELANAKIASNAVADSIQANLKTLAEMKGEHSSLFPDVLQIVLKENDDLVALIKTRIADHKQAEEDRKKAAEDQRIADEQKQAEEKPTEKVEPTKQPTTQGSFPGKLPSKPATDNKMIRVICAAFPDGQALWFKSIGSDYINKVIDAWKDKYPEFKDTEATLGFIEIIMPEEYFNRIYATNNSIDWPAVNAS